MRNPLAGAVALALLLTETPTMAQDVTADAGSALLRAVGVTSDVEPLLVFYRDLLGQVVIADGEIKGGPESGSLFLQLAADQSARFVQLRGDTTGMVRPPVGASDIAFIELPGGPVPMQPGDDLRGQQGDMILVHQVRDIDTIWARLQAAKVPVLIPLRTSPSGKSRQAIVVDPLGRLVEIYQLNP